MSDPLAADAPPVRQEPAFVTYLTWRPSVPIVEADLDRLTVGLEDADAEVCLQLPTHEEANYVVSLGSMAAGYYEAAVESVSLLLTATAALGIDANLIEADVVSEEGQANFDCDELSRASRS